MTGLPNRAFLATVTAPAPLWQEHNTALGGLYDVVSEQPGGWAETALTIASGAVTPTKAVHSIDTETGAAEDDLTNIDPANHPAGRFLLIRGADPARIVTVVHGFGGIGQIVTVDSGAFVLDAPDKRLLLLRDGDLWHWQAGPGPIIAPAGQRTFLPDLWYVEPQGGDVTIARSSFTPASARANWSLQITGGPGVTTVKIGQRVEADMAPLVSSQITFTARIERPLGGDLTPSLVLGTPGARNDFSVVTERARVVLPVVSAAGWGTRAQTVVVDYPGDENGLQVEWEFPAGALDSASKMIRFTGAQAERGGGDTFVEIRPPAIELALIGRQYERLVFGAASPGPIAHGHIQTGTQFYAALSYQPKVKIPNATFSPGANFQVVAPTFFTPTNVFAANFGLRSLLIVADIVGGTAGHGAFIEARLGQPDAVITLDARL